MFGLVCCLLYFAFCILISLFPGFSLFPVFLFCLFDLCLLYLLVFCFVFFIVCLLLIYCLIVEQV